MLYYKNLRSLFFDSFPAAADRFFALSGFVGPGVIKDLQTLPFDSDVIFGLYKENQKALLHQQLLSINSKKTRIHYPDILCHSKCYLWLKDDKPLRGLIGSANFSENGLQNDYRETLFEIDKNQLYPLKGYIELIFGSAKPCTAYKLEEIQKREKERVEPTDLTTCEMVLYDPETGQTQNSNGLNWGMGTGHTKPNDACIPIRMDHIKQFPKLFPPKQVQIADAEDENEVVELIWDDGTIMQGRLEGNNYRTENNCRVKYPKQIASYPNKQAMGIYFRKRLGLPLNSNEKKNKITREHLIQYGRDSATVSLLEEGVYQLDFSPTSVTVPSVLVNRIIKNPLELASHRKQQGISIVQLAELTGISQKKLVLFEKGKELLPLEQIEIIVRKITRHR